MPPVSTRAPSVPTDGAAFDVSAPKSAAPLIFASVAILLAAVVGLYRGFVSVREQAAGPNETPTAGISGATPAVALPHNPNWSTLSGPQILPPPVAKPKAEEADSASDNADAEPSQAEQALAPAPDAAPPAEAAPQAAKPAVPSANPPAEPN